MGKVSASLSGLAVLLFMVPWITVYCGEQKVFTFSGTDLVIGEVPQRLWGSMKRAGLEKLDRDISDKAALK